MCSETKTERRRATACCRRTEGSMQRSFGEGCSNCSLGIFLLLSICVHLVLYFVEQTGISLFSTKADAGASLRQALVVVHRAMHRRSWVFDVVVLSQRSDSGEHVSWSVFKYIVPYHQQMYYITLIYYKRGPI